MIAQSKWFYWFWIFFWFIFICFWGIVFSAFIFSPTSNSNPMTVLTWGDLAKSQADNETIEEAIARLIQAHDDDSNAHLDAGQSLLSHKASAIIDHVARSVYRDKLAFDRFQFETYFESIDGFTKTGGVALEEVALVSLNTTAILNNEQRIYAGAIDANELGAKPANSPFWLTRVKFVSTTTQLAYIMSGDYGIPVGWGFKIVNGSLYAWYIDSGDSEVTTEITGVTLTNWNTYKLEFESGASIKFYVNGVLKVTATTNLPTGAASNFIGWWIKTTDTAVRTMYVQYAIYDEDFFL